MSKGGGSTTTSTSQAEIPDWVQDAAKANLSRADYVSRLGYVPQYGIDVAGFTPMQSSAMQNTANAAAAFGLQAPVDAMAGMPQTQTNNLGFTGYSSGDIYDTYQANLKRRSPDQYNLMQGMFGETPDIVFTPEGSITTTAAPSAVRGAANYTASSDGSFVDPKGIPYNRNVFNDFGELEGWKAGLVGLLPFGSAIVAYNNSQAQKAKEAYEQEINKNALLMPTKGFDPSGTDYAGAIASVQPAYSGGSYTPSTSGNYGVGGNWSSSSSSGGGYTGGGASYGANPSSTISGGSDRTDGGFGW